MSTSVLSATFRDPAGSLSFEDDRVVRRIHAAARPAVLEFLDSAFCLRAQQRGDLIAATIDDAPAGLLLHHPRIPIPTYPWEWSPSQWVAAAQLTLDLCDEALDDGWILKDATPLNVLFVGPRPVFVDILSFERRDPHTSVWLAYGQYMRTFLLPLITHQQMGWPLELSLFKRDGYEPTELYQAMGWSQRLSRAAFWPVTLPAWLERRQQTAAAAAKPDAAAKPAGRQNDPELAAHLLKRTLATLRTRTARVLGKDSQSKWSDYPATLTHYTPEQSARKREWVSHALTGLKPARVLDIGANTGEYSALAASLGAEVIALERDAAAAERLFQMTRARELAIQTIHADLSRPTPAIGWDNRESATLLSRLEGRFDVVMMLAVIHHLVLMEQIPLPAILALVSRLTCGHLIVEWVPVEDPMYQSLMRGREDLYGSLSEADLMDACREHFSLQRRESLTNGRVLLLFAKHAPTLT